MNKIVRLGDICDLKNGFAFKSNDYVEKSNTLNIRMSNIRPDGNFDEMHKARYLPDSFSEKYKEFLLKDNDLIIAMTDMAGDPKILGLPTIVKNSNERKFLLNQRVGKLHKFSNEIYVPYLCYFLKTLKKYFKNKGAGGLQVNISKQEILSANIILKPITEQKKIVTKLDTIFAEIDKNIAIKKNSSNEFNLLKLSVLKNLFDGPKIKLGDLYQITSSKRVFKSEWKEKGVPFYRAREIVKLANKKPFKNPIYISEDMYDLYSKKYSVPKEGDILITGVGTLGITYLVKKNDKFYFKDGNIIWLKKKDKNINSNYIECVFKSPFVRAQITNSIGATVGTLTIQKAKELSIPYPSLEIQNKIMNKINKFFTYIYDYEKTFLKNIDNYIALKDSLVKYYTESK